MTTALIPQLIETLRDVVGDSCESHTDPRDTCPTCRAVALLGQATDAVAVLRAPAPYGSYGQFLVTVWADGTGELARRDEEGQRWSAPVPLRIAE